MINFQFEKLDCIDSTNDYLTREIEEGRIVKDKIVVTKHQTNGHGSNGRSFLSPKDTGIYFTFLHLYKDAKELNFITQKTAVAVYRAFKEIFDIELSIKWVNDLYYKDKKICGILCRNLIKHNAVIVGVGIDLFENEEALSEIEEAGYIFKNKRELIKILETNSKLPKDNCTRKNIYDDFKSLEIEGIELRDDALWEPDHIVIEIVMRLYALIGIDGLPKLYVDKNIIKDKKIYEDCILEC